MFLYGHRATGADSYWRASCSRALLEAAAVAAAASAQPASGSGSGGGGSGLAGGGQAALKQQQQQLQASGAAAAKEQQRRQIFGMAHQETAGELAANSLGGRDFCAELVLRHKRLQLQQAAQERASSAGSGASDSPAELEGQFERQFRPEEEEEEDEDEEEELETEELQELEAQHEDQALNLSLGHRRAALGGHSERAPTETISDEDKLLLGRLLGEQLQLRQHQDLTEAVLAQALAKQQQHQVGAGGSGAAGSGQHLAIELQQQAQQMLAQAAQECPQEELLKQKQRPPPLGPSLSANQQQLYEQLSHALGAMAATGSGAGGASGSGGGALQALCSASGSACVSSGGSSSASSTCSSFAYEASYSPQTAGPETVSRLHSRASGARMASSSSRHCTSSTSTNSTNSTTATTVTTSTSSTTSSRSASTSSSTNASTTSNTDTNNTANFINTNLNNFNANLNINTNLNSRNLNTNTNVNNTISTRDCELGQRAASTSLKEHLQQQLHAQHQYQQHMQQHAAALAHHHQHQTSGALCSPLGLHSPVHPNQGLLLPSSQAGLSSSSESADDLDRIRNFIEEFKHRRGALGLTQKQAAQCFRAYTNDRYAFSDNFVGHFEGFQFRPQTAMTIADSLAEWLEFAEEETRQGRQLSFMPGKVKETRKRKYEVIRIRDSAKKILVEAFEKNRSPSTGELEQLSRKTNIPSRNIEIFFKNRRTSRQYHH